MRKSGMVLAVFAALGMFAVGCGKTEEPKKGPEGTGTNTGPGPGPAKFAVDPWTSWNGCKEGTSIVLEMDSAGNKMEFTKTLDKKGEPHMLKVKMKMGDNVMDSPDEKVEKLKTGAATDGDCPLCKKKFSAHKDESKWSKEKVKVGDKDIECDVNESAAKNCKGEDNAFKSKTWYSNEVPGQMVKMESEAGGQKTKMWVSKFEKK